jgi:hypothetical protein
VGEGVYVAGVGVVPAAAAETLFWIIKTAPPPHMNMNSSTAHPVIIRPERSARRGGI